MEDKEKTKTTSPLTREEIERSYPDLNIIAATEEMIGRTTVTPSFKAVPDDQKQTSAHRNILRPLIIAGTPKTPRIQFDADRGALAISGSSRLTTLSTPTNANDFYKPLIEWLEEYAKMPSQRTEFTIQMESYDAAGAQYLTLIFKKLEPILQGGADIMVFWYYKEGDNAMLESGEDYKSIIRLPFTFISY
jgi:hypothetical protein